MTIIHHLNCGTLKASEQLTILCHCLLLEDKRGLALVDAGIGLADCLHPLERIGQELIQLSGFQFNLKDTAVRQIETLGLNPQHVKHVVISHLDPDHIGGLADFPQATVHLGQEEFDTFNDGHFRHRPVLLAHHPTIVTYDQSQATWFGLEARRVHLHFASRVYLIPLFGHTIGHCGIAVEQGDQWLLYVGDAYYLREELFVDQHPVEAVAAANAMDNEQRMQSLATLRHLIKDHSGEITMFGYHDPTEFRPG